jgi:hypothetical protein
MWILQKVKMPCPDRPRTPILLRRRPLPIRHYRLLALTLLSRCAIPLLNQPSPPPSPHINPLLLRGRHVSTPPPPVPGALSPVAFIGFGRLATRSAKLASSHSRPPSRRSTMWCVVASSVVRPSPPAQALTPSDPCLVDPLEVGSGPRATGSSCSQLAWEGSLVLDVLPTPARYVAFSQ